MSPAELRAEAKTLRKRAKDLDAEADRIEQEAIAVRRRESSRAALEAKAAAHCRPIWKVPPDPVYAGVYVVLAIESGCFMVRDLLAISGNVGPHPYRTRDGRYGGSYYDQAGDGTRRAVLDNVATMLAWRAWCAARKQPRCNGWRVIPCGNCEGAPCPTCTPCPGCSDCAARS